MITNCFSVLSVVLLFVTVFLNGASSQCSKSDKEAYIQRTFGFECRVAVQAITRPAEILDGIDFDLACSTSCLGTYTKWLEDECGDRETAMLTRLSCMRNMDTAGGVISRCRLAFPDIADEVFSSTQQCVSVIQSPSDTCSLDCKVPLNDLIDKFGCCFLPLYNSTEAITRFLNTGYLDPTQASVLNLFQSSETLASCREEAVSPACTASPFAAHSNSATHKITFSIVVVLFVVSLLLF